jgi:hypothetical protein
MSPKITGLLLSAWLLAAGAAAGQGDAVQAKKPAQSTEMYEDIEIFRRLLAAKLQGQYVNLSSSFLQPWGGYGAAGSNYDWNGLQGFSGGSGNQGSGFGGTGLQGSGLSGTTFQGSGLAGMSGRTNLYGGFNGYVVRRSFDLEGVYLKGQGVVFTATLPPPDRDPLGSSSKVSVKPLSDWDRARMEIRGEKPAQARPPAPKSPGLAELVLKTMADNGHRFRQLAENENLTVVITFRSLASSGAPLAIYYLTGQGSGGTSAYTVDRKGTPSSARDYELLGDLHMRQGKKQDAVKAYLDAFKLDPGQRLLGKVVTAYVAMDKTVNVNDTQKFIQRLEAYLKANETKPVEASKVAAPSTAGKSLPAKLIISASKALLDQAGAGKIDFEAFKKAATVEYLTFGSTTK